MSPSLKRRAEHCLSQLQFYQNVFICLWPLIQLIRNYPQKRIRDNSNNLYPSPCYFKHWEIRNSPNVFLYSFLFFFPPKFLQWPCQCNEQNTWIYFLSCLLSEYLVLNISKDGFTSYRMPYQEWFYSLFKSLAFQFFRRKKSSTPLVLSATVGWGRKGEGGCWCLWEWGRGREQSIESGKEKENEEGHRDTWWDPSKSPII